MAVYNSVTELVGGTPLLRLNGYEARKGLSAALYAKLEYLNPAGSVKDRVAMQMISDAEKSGKLKKGSTIIEPTSGNTGIGLAMIAAAKGYKAIIVMPDTMSVERRELIKAYGAQIYLSVGSLGMKGAIELSNSLHEQIENSVIMGQFVNPSNPEAHRSSTGPEIWNDMNGKVDMFVAGVGTGGTVTGVGEYLKSKDKKIKIVAVEPADSPVLAGGKAGAHKLQGIGAGFVPEILNTDIYDDIVAVTTDEAFAAARLLAASDGVLIGISSGAALHAATVLAERAENKGKNIVVLLPDTGDRYLSTPLFSIE